MIGQGDGVKITDKADEGITFGGKITGLYEVKATECRRCCRKCCDSRRYCVFSIKQLESESLYRLSYHRFLLIEQIGQ